MMIAWNVVLTVIVFYEFGKWSYSELKMRYKIRRGTAYRNKEKGVLIQGGPEWVAEMRDLFENPHSLQGSVRNE